MAWNDAEVEANRARTRTPINRFSIRSDYTALYGTDATRAGARVELNVRVSLNISFLLRRRLGQLWPVL